MKHLIATLILLAGMAPSALAYRRTDYFCPPRPPLGFDTPRKCVKLSLLLIRNTDSTHNINYTVEGRTRMLRPGSGVYVALKNEGLTIVTIDGEKTVQFNAKTHNLSFWRYNIGGEIGYRLVPKNTSLIEK